MTNNIEVHRADLSEPATITFNKMMRRAVQESGQSDPAVTLSILAENDAKAIVNALIEHLPFQTLALVRDRLTRFAS